MDPEAALATNKSDGHSHLDLADCRRCVLDHQRIILGTVTERFSSSGDESDSLSPAQVEERLGQLQHEPDLSPELKAAMEDMNEAARAGVCKLILFKEELSHCESESVASSSRNLQDEGRLERTKLMEYFVLCKASLKLECVVKFMNMSIGDSIFEKEGPTGGCSTEESEKDGSSSSTAMMFPQSRLEHVQRLLAKGMGWDPVFVTSELRKIFVEKPGDVDYSYYDNEVMILFQQLVEQMQNAIRTATLQVKSKQDTQLLNDLGKGGNTRVVSVQYSEYEVDQTGAKVESKNNAPEARIDERQQLTEEEQKNQLRLASEAAILQQTILGELLSMDEDEREHTLKEAAEASRIFMEEAMALPMGQERIDYLRSIDAATSRKLAMYKLWDGMLRANGGKPPKMVPQK